MSTTWRRCRECAACRSRRGRDRGYARTRRAAVRRIGIRFGIGPWSLIVGKADDGFDTRITDIGEVRVESIEHILRDVGLAPVIEADVEVDQGVAEQTRRTEACGAG